MTRNISLDIGFNRLALPKEGNFSSKTWWRWRSWPQLQYGFTFPDQVGNPVVVARSWETEWKMLVTLYDLTENDYQEDPASIELLSLRIRFQKALWQEFNVPVVYHGEPMGDGEGSADFLDFQISPTLTGTGYSTVFENKPYPSWHVFPATNQGAHFPDNQLNADNSGPSPCFDVDFPGSFYYSVELAVKTRSERRVQCFRVDPEMVVENDGSGPESGILTD